MPWKLCLTCEEHSGFIHLVVTDVVMPQMSGFELVNNVARVRPKTKVIYMSGHIDNPLIHQNIKKPGTEFLQKPFTPSGLAHKVRQVLDG